MTKVNQTQVGGNHYQKGDYQLWDFIDENNIPWLEGSVMKYVIRHKDKGGNEDLEKAAHYLDKICARKQKRQIDYSPDDLYRSIKSYNLTSTEELLIQATLMGNIDVAKMELRELIKGYVAS